jgi:hypothetical protein
MGQQQAPKQFAPPQALGMPTRQDMVSPMKAPDPIGGKPLIPIEQFTQNQVPTVISPNSVGKQQTQTKVDNARQLRLARLNPYGDDMESVGLRNRAFWGM